MLKTKNICLYVLLAFLLMTITILSTIKVKIDRSPKPDSRQDYSGERIIYDVMLRKLFLGKTYFSNISYVQVNGNLLNLMILETKLRHFTDTEKVYSNPETFLPVRVERDIRNWFMREKITEEYNQKDFTLTIIKKRGAKEEKTVIKKDSYIHNAALLPYFVRRVPKLDIGRIITANLPNRRFEIRLVSIDDIKVPAGTFKAYHFKSTPKQFEIWISADDHRIPLKIHNTGVFGYSMVMTEYSATNPEPIK